MSTAHFSPLPHRAFVAVSGADRFSFLQGLVSNDIKRVEGGRAAWAAFLTPQGKFLHEFFMIPQGDAVLLECERARRDDLMTRLSRYKLRSKVVLLADDALTPGAAWGPGVLEKLNLGDEGAPSMFGGGMTYADPRLKDAGARWGLPVESLKLLENHGLTQASPEAYDAHRIALGLPDGSRDMEIDKALLLENGFPELHGVDFEKGCYVGQELTARTHYRALIKKRLMPVTIDGPTPSPGTALTANGANAGEMKSAVGNVGLALVRLEAWRAAGGALMAEGAKVTPRVPDWMELSE